jgi:hypothetical protein
MVTGATGEISSPPRAGDALTAATGGGATVVDGELGELLLAADADSDGPPAMLAGPSPPVVCTAANPDDEPEQAAVTASTPATTTAIPSRRTELELCNFIWSSGRSAAGPGRFVVML